MNKYSKKERNKIYKEAHEKYDSFLKNTFGNLWGACEAITLVLTGGFEESEDIVTEETFPELFMFKDDVSRNCLWLDYKTGFDNCDYEKRKQIRKDVLMFCEEMTS